jgi:Tfp pilus assembly protein PilX
MSDTTYTSPATPVVSTNPVQPNQVVYSDAQRDFDAADLAVADAERALKAALQVRADRANVAVEAGVRESTAKHDAVRARNNDLASKANADAFDRAHARLSDVAVPSPRIGAVNTTTPRVDVVNADALSPTL